MIFHHTGSKDAYITNKIIGGVRRATDGNVGYASTIDMFKLHNESQLAGSSGDIQEVSRGLVYFDLSQLKTIIETKASSTHSSLKIKLVLTDVQGTQVAPSDFTLQLYALKAAWEEGIGSNVTAFNDLDATNWISRSLGTEWTTAGAFEGDETLVGSQAFTTGEENLEIDVTTWVKSHWADSSSVPNHGWLLKFTASQETNNKSYFVKRFATRHARNPFVRPKIVASWENYYLDDRLEFDAMTTNKIAIRNFSKGVPTSFPSSSVPSLTLSSGSWSKTGLSCTAVSLAGKAQDGMYQASFKMDVINDSDYTDLATNLFATGSLVIQEKWYDGTFLIHSGSFVLNNPQASTTGSPKDMRFSIIDLKSVYETNEFPVIRLFLRDRNLANEPSVRIPIQLPSQIIHKAYYQIRDTNSLVVLIPFSDKLSTPDESTRISSDAEGMFFSFPTSVLPRGRTYTIDIAYYDRGERRVFESNNAFRVS